MPIVAQPARPAASRRRRPHSASRASTDPGRQRARLATSAHLHQLGGPRAHAGTRPARSCMAPGDRPGDSACTIQTPLSTSRTPLAQTGRRTTRASVVGEHRSRAAVTRPCVRAPHVVDRTPRVAHRLAELARARAHCSTSVAHVLGNEPGAKLARPRRAPDCACPATWRPWRGPSDGARAGESVAHAGAPPVCRDRDRAGYIRRRRPRRARRGEHAGEVHRGHTQPIRGPASRPCLEAPASARL